MTSLATDSADLADVLQKTLSRSDQPLPASKLTQQLTGPFRTSRESVAEVLASLAARGCLHEFAPYRTREPRYWTRNAEDYIRETLLSLLARKVMTRSQLRDSYKNLLKGIAEKRIARVFGDLLAANAIQKLPRFIRGRTDIYSAKPPQVTDYVDDAIEQLTKKLSPCGISPAQIIAAFAARQQTGPEAVTADRSPEISAPPPMASSRQTQPVESTARGSDPALLDQIQERLREDLQQHRSPIALVADLRQALCFQDISKAEFDRAVLELRRRQIVELDRHDHADSLRPDQREVLVRDDHGNYFNAISFRSHQ